MLEGADIPIVDRVRHGGRRNRLVRRRDYLRIAGVPAHDMKVLTPLDFPWQSYQYLTRVSQIPQGERLRCDSASNPDNIWGPQTRRVRTADDRSGSHLSVSPSSGKDAPGAGVRLPRPNSSAQLAAWMLTRRAGPKPGLRANLPGCGGTPTCRRQGGECPAR